jgi:hypothetical protein
VLGVLILLAVISCTLYRGVAALSRRFHYGSSEAERPIVWVLILFAVAFLVYLTAIWIAARAKQDRWLLGVIFISSLVFRITLLPSTPIQEVDIYRYLWDGAVLSEGVSPFRYSPQQVRDASAEQRLEADLARLVQMRDSNPSLHTILNRIHYPQVPTVYPPVSQAVFAGAALTTPKSATVECRLIVMKVWLVAFDMLTLVLVVGLLRLAGRSIGLSVIYGWCPLLMKEVANSGHLDAIAVLLTAVFAYLLARLVNSLNGKPKVPANPAHSRLRRAVKRGVGIFQTRRGIAIAAAIVLALGVGAKLYPVVLAPLLAACAARHAGWRTAVVTMLVFAAVMVLIMWPMAPPLVWNDTSETDLGSTAEGGAETAASASTGDPSLGLRTFLRRWEMNEFLFLLLIENLKVPPPDSGPADVKPPVPTAWFSVVPDSFRETLNELVTGELDTAKLSAHEIRLIRWEASFLVARAVTACAFLLLAGWFTWRALRSSDRLAWLEYSFLTLAWFWLLCPTQNPWYWTWVLPLLPFARSRVWLAMSGLVLLYYLRFWLGYHFSDTPVLGTGYHGLAFFDLVITWVEYAPWFLCLTVTYLWSQRERKSANRAQLADA